MTETREQAVEHWVAGVLGSRDFVIAPASADASFRRYFRVCLGGASYIVMDAPPPQEDTGPFVRIARLLTDAGIRAPRVLAEDRAAGFVLLSDLGSVQLLQALRDGAPPEPLYDAAIDTLVAMQVAGERRGWALPPYDTALLMRETALFSDWLVERHLGVKMPRRNYEAVEALLVGNAHDQPRIFVHRDFHSRNLMVTDTGAPGVLDFQDAVRGPASYDIVSLLRDCYVSWPQLQLERWLERYWRHAVAVDLDVGPDLATFRRWFDLMGVQRHLKAAGIFARLKLRDGKDGYIADLPRTLDYVVAVARQYPALHWLGGFVEDRVLPQLAATDLP